MSRGPLRSAPDIVGAAAAGYGQILFCESAASGACFYVGLALLAPATALTGALSVVLATLTARALGYPGAAWRAGLHGYAGALVGLFWPSLFAAGPRAWALLVAAAAASTPLTRLAHRLLTPREIPALALPVLPLLWLAGGVLDPAPPAAPTAPALQILGWTALAAGLILHSRPIALSAAIGAAIGLAESRLLGGGMEPGLLANSVPTAIALGAVLLPWSGSAVAIAASGAARHRSPASAARGCSRAEASCSVSQ